MEQARSRSSLRTTHAELGVRAKWKGFAVVFARVEGGLAVMLWEGCWREERRTAKKIEKCHRPFCKGVRKIEETKMVH